jgi:hypothetical protein
VRIETITIKTKTIKLKNPKIEYTILLSQNNYNQIQAQYNRENINDLFSQIITINDITVNSSPNIKDNQIIVIHKTLINKWKAKYIT